jgi:hypothetical protein
VTTPRALVLEPWLAALARVGLDGDLQLDRAGWEERLPIVAAQGLPGLLQRAADLGLVDLTASESEHLADLVQRATVTSLRLEAELIRLEPFLRRAGGVVLKGPVLAHGVYDDPRWRPFTDLDVLVPSDCLADAVTELGRLGYARSWPDPSPHFVERVAKAVTFTHPAVLNVDLHRTLAPGRAASGIRPDEVLAGSIEVRTGDRLIPAPGWDVHLIECALHAVMGHRLTRVLPLRDIAGILLSGNVDGTRVAAMSEAWGVGTEVAVGLEHASAVTGVPLGGSLETWVRRSHARPHRRPRPGVREELTRVRSLVAPRPAFLRWRYGAMPVHRLYLRRWSDLVRANVRLEDRVPAA